MKHSDLFIAVMTTLSLAGILPASAGSFAASVRATHLQQAIILKAGERLFFPPPDAPGTARPKLTEETVQKAVDAQLKARFDAAAGSSPKLTAQQARDAGWGFIADHFAEIDRDKTGFVTLRDISRYMAVRSPIQPKKAPTPVQIIE